MKTVADENSTTVSVKQLSLPEHQTTFIFTIILKYSEGSDKIHSWLYLKTYKNVHSWNTWEVENSEL